MPPAQPATPPPSVTMSPPATPQRDQTEEEDRRNVKAQFQKVATRMNMEHFQQNWEARVERKLARWQLDWNRRRWRDAFVVNMAVIGKLVAPRVAAAVWGMAWNRWCTMRRFQRRSHCQLGCEGHEDSIEHYMGCRVARKIGWTMLRLPERGDYDERKRNLIGAAKGEVVEQTCWYLLAYAILKPTNGRRNSGKRGGEAEKLRQDIPNAVGGHRKSGGVVRSRWRAVRQGIWPGIRPGVQRGVIPGLQGCSKQQARQCPKGATGSTRAVGPTRGAGSRGAGSTRGSVSGCPCSNEAVPRTCNCPGATTISDAA